MFLGGVEREKSFLTEAISKDYSTFQKDTHLS